MNVEPYKTKRWARSVGKQIDKMLKWQLDTGSTHNNPWIIGGLPYRNKQIEICKRYIEEGIFFDEEKREWVVVEDAMALSEQERHQVMLLHSAEHWNLWSWVKVTLPKRQWDVESRSYIEVPTGYTGFYSMGKEDEKIVVKMYGKGCAYIVPVEELMIDFDYQLEEQ